MGFGSNGVMDACAARSLAETPADRISLKLVVNALGTYYNERTYVSAGLNMLLTIRDKQPDTHLFDESEIHPNAEAQLLIAKRFSELAFGLTGFLRLEG